MAVEVRVSPQAVEQVRAAQRWWAANREAAPSPLRDELAKGLQRLAELPEIGPPYPNDRVPGVRRLLLRKSQYHIYYVYDARGPGLVVVLAIWSARRGREPRL
ncbi:MAG: type II toxin-antitoxin system RelE/ParE family toxin [Myxococcales bacterium]|nr:type II toxin-antitoxin system RelE/ParE family toxin [Myxococcales bacterium]